MSLNTTNTNNTDYTILAQDIEKRNLVLKQSKKNPKVHYLNYIHNGRTIIPYIQFPDLTITSGGLTSPEFAKGDDRKASKLTVPVTDNKNIIQFGNVIDAFMTDPKNIKQMGFKKKLNYHNFVKTDSNGIARIKFTIRNIYTDKNKIETVLTNIYEKESDRMIIKDPKNIEDIRKTISYLSTIKVLGRLAPWTYLGSYGVNIIIETICVTPSTKSINNNNIEVYKSKTNNPFIENSDEEPEDNNSVKLTNEEVNEEISDSDSSDSDSSDEEVKPVVKSKPKVRKVRKSKK